MKDVSLLHGSKGVYFPPTCRHNYMASPESLDCALCEAVQRGWWWGASRLVAAGASAHAAYKTTMWRQEEVTRYVYVCVCAQECVDS